MKPLCIRMKNIGPFVDEKLDFTQLEEVFLLCGDTGAGKTTIFDAMTFALYGEFLGARKGKSKDFRSQFAKEEDESFVEFEFSSDAEKYRVIRTLPRPYINRNKKEDVEPSKLSVEMWNRKDEKYEFINAGKKEMDARLAQIVGLNAPEFSKIVVLPQGEFSEFLRSNSNVKQDILKKLFPIDFYQSIVEKVKEKNVDLQGRINGADAAVKELLKENDFTGGEEKLASFEKEFEENKLLLKKLNEEKENLGKSMAKLDAELKMADELERSIEKKKELDKEEAEMKVLEEKLLLSDDADSIVPFIDSKKVRLNEVKEAVSELNESKAETENAEEKFKTLKENESEISKVEKLIDENKILLKDYEDKLEAAEKYSELLEENKNAEKKLESVKKLLKNNGLKLKDYEKKLYEKIEAVGLTAVAETSEAYRLVNDKFSKAKEKSQYADRVYTLALKVQEIEKKIADSEKTLLGLNEKKKECLVQIENSQKLFDEYKAAKEEQGAKNSAFAIASFLKPGCSCPVCGSKEHPSPATAPKDFLDFDEKISTAERSIKTETELLSSCSEKIAAEEKILEKFREDVCELKKECKDVSVEKAMKDADNLKEEMYSLQDAQENCEIIIKDIESEKVKTIELKDKVAEAESECASVEATLKALENQVKKTGGNKTDPAEILKDIENLKVLLEEEQKQVSLFRKEFEEAGLNLEKCRAKESAASKTLATGEKNLKEAEDTLKEKLEGSKFSSETEALSCYIEKAEKDSLKSTVKNFRQEQSRLETSIEVLSGKVSEKLSILKERFLKLESEMDTSVEKIDQASKKVDSILAEKTSFEKDFVKYREKSAELAKLESEGKALSKLCKDLTGNNPSKIQFETWFLGLYFDDVVVCANRHLLKISGERYEFKMDTDKTGGNSYHGLDLVVHDYQVNKDRDTATLSGGETFMASISLALGLTEVVQKSSRLDSLFIDEGFGSLDKESLEMAVGVLQDIGNSKTVGVISHVEEMLGAIACHVNVKKGPKGSHISL